MPDTTSLAPRPTFESIDLAVLLDVQGGCGKKHQDCGSCAPQAIVIAAAAAPAAAPAPMAPPPMPRDSVSTSVSVGYR